MRLYGYNYEDFGVALNRHMQIRARLARQKDWLFNLLQVPLVRCRSSDPGKPGRPKYRRMLPRNASGQRYALPTAGRQAPLIQTAAVVAQQQNEAQ